MYFNKSNSNSSYIEIEGRKKIFLYRYWNYLCIFSFGILYMISKYYFYIKILLTTKKCNLKNSDCVVIRNKFNKIELRDIIEFNPTKNLMRYNCNGKIKIIDTEYARFIYDNMIEKYVSVSYNVENLPYEELLIKNKFFYYEPNILLEREILFGKNYNNLRLPSNFEILLKNTFNIENFINLFCIILWFNIEYKIYASIIGIMIFYSYIEEIWSEILHKKELEKSQQKKKVKVFRNGKFVIKNATEIYPGDFIYIEIGDNFPCDAIIKKGDVIADESFLTGESVPVCKSHQQNSIVYSGTSILKSSILEHNDNCYKIANIKAEEQFNNFYSNSNTNNKYNKKKIIPEGYAISDDNQNSVFTKQVTTIKTENYAIGLVIGTGFNTARGKILRDILNSQPVYVGFLHEAYMYIYYTIFIGLLLSIFYFLYFVYISEWELLQCFVYTADLFFTLASPALYASLSVGIQLSNRRLKKDNIKCNNLDRIYIAGNIDIAIFDKTGTLTCEGMDFLCLDDCKNAINSIEKVNLLTRIGLSTCHSVYELDGKYTGDSLDIQMFIFSKSVLKLNSNNSREIIFECLDENFNSLKNNKNTEKTINYFEFNEINNFDGEIIKILKTYDFSSDLKRMSVIVQIKNKKFIFCKGSPDTMQKLIKNIPKDYEKKINEYSLMGYRLITIAYKEISHFSNRENYEKDLIFLNLIIFSNKLKSETTKVIEELNYANIKSVICTGDNMLTAISVGKECKLIEEGAVVVFPIVSDDCKTIDDVKWECLSEEAYTFDKIRLGLYKNTFDTFNKDFVVACEGREFEFFKKNNGLSFILEKCVVFARFSSGLKKALVEDLRSLNKNILFCGDGANDSGAISSADVGIALSKNEASLASSFNAICLDSVPLLIKECRNAYVTSIARFKYVSMTYILAFICLAFPVLRNLFLSDFQTLHVDIFIIVPLTYCLSSFKKSKIISKIRPKTSIFNYSEMISFFTSLLLQIIIIGIFSTYGESSEEITESSKAGTMIFYITCFQSIFNALYFSDCSPYREKIRQNRLIIYFTFVFICYNLLLLLLNLLSFNFLENHLFFSHYLFVPITKTEFIKIVIGIISNIIPCFIIPLIYRHYFNN